MTTYRGAGVDVTRAEDALARVRERIARTRRPEVIGGIGAFAGLFALGTAYRDPVLVATTDGVGTKLELARVLDRHEVVGTDLVHHCVNDALALGAEPLFFLDYFSTSRLEIEGIRRHIGADSLGYLSLDGMIAATGATRGDLCTACFTGDYPVPVQLELTKDALEREAART